MKHRKKAKCYAVMLNSVHTRFLQKQFVSDIFWMSQSSLVCTQLNNFKYCYYLLTIKLFQILLFIVCTHLDCFNYSKRLNNPFWPIDCTLTGTTTLGQSGTRSNGNEEVLKLTQISQTGVSLLNDFTVVGVWGSLTLCRDAVGIFWSPIQQS